MENVCADVGIILKQIFEEQCVKVSNRYIQTAWNMVVQRTTVHMLMSYWAS